MEVLAIAGLILLLVLWIVAECKMGRGARISCGLLAIVGVAGFAYFLSSQITLIIPRYESDFHRMSMRGLEALIKEGHPDWVAQAIEVYNREIQRGASTHKAAMSTHCFLTELEVKRNEAERNRSKPQ